MNRAIPVALGVVLVIAAALRGLGAAGGLWLDEIWSINIARQLQHPLHILMAARIDNNHPLNTLLLWMMGHRLPDWAYRVPAVIASIGTVALVWAWNRRRGEGRALLAGLLVAVSFPMVVYGSEARGYAYAGACLMLCLVAIDRARRGIGGSVVYIASAAAGILAHPTFIPALAAVIVFDLRRAGMQRRAILMHSAAAAVAIGFWAVFLRHLSFGGGSEANIAQTIIQTQRLAMAYSLGDGAAPAVAAVATLATAVSLVALHHRRDERWVLYLCGVVVFPVVAVMVVLLANAEAAPLAPRYFLLPMLLQLLLWCDALPRGRMPAIGALLVAGFVAANLWADVLFAIHGRGDFREVMRAIGSPAAAVVVTVGSDNEFRAKTMLSRYAPGAAGNWNVRYVEHAGPADAPTWVLVQSVDDEARAPVEIGGGALRYAWVCTVRHYGPSGITWRVYRRAP